MGDRRHAKLGIYGLAGGQRDEMSHWRATKLPTTKHLGADRRSRQLRKRWNWGLLAALLINALLWAGIYWIIAALF
ncbi:hypothetical protein XH99_06930 [Bradyrhizobium nanningense]|uniref:Uncharacterized protein n=1 Tax=Bradyrhizobium nanningense TaxID=1325118 RepID=A0A4Q0SH28_9BRAD|nr:hypothetical protein XH99_06930 [Bradyrhizobium nanningense]